MTFGQFSGPSRDPALFIRTLERVIRSHVEAPTSLFQPRMEVDGLKRGLVTSLCPEEFRPPRFILTAPAVRDVETLTVGPPIVEAAATCIHDVYADGSHVFYHGAWMPDGNLWLISNAGGESNYLVRFSPISTKFTHFSLPTNSRSTGLICYAQGFMWIPAPGISSVLKYDMAGALAGTYAIAEWTGVPPSFDFTAVFDMHAGSDGNIWLAIGDSVGAFSNEGRLIRVATDGSYTAFTPTLGGGATHPIGHQVIERQGRLFTYSPEYLHEWDLAGNLTSHEWATAYGVVNPLHASVDPINDAEMWYWDYDRPTVGARRMAYRVNVGPPLTIEPIELPASLITSGYGQPRAFGFSESAVWGSSASGLQRIDRENDSVRVAPIGFSTFKPALAPDDGLWGTGGGRWYRLDPITEAVSSCASTVDSNGFSESFGPDGNFWFWGTGGVVRVYVPGGELS